MMRNYFRKIDIISLISFLVLVLGIIDIFSAITPAIPERLFILRPFVPFLVRSAVRLGTALIGFGLIVLSRGLGKRKQVAWAVAIGFLIISFIFHLIKGLDVEEASITLGLLAVLIYERKKFTAQPDVPSVLQGIVYLTLAFIFTLFYGTIGYFILERGIRGAFTLQRAFMAVFNTFFLISPAPVSRNILITGFFDSIFLIGFISISFGLYLIFRPVIFRHEASEEDREKVRKLFSKFGRNYVAEIILLPGKYYFFNDDSGFVAYKPVGDYAISLGEPVGYLKNRYKNIVAFSDFCKTKGWSPVFVGVDKDFTEVAKKAGMNNVLVGHTAIIDLTSYDFEGSKKKPLRYSVSIMERLGYTFDVKTPPITDRDMSELKKTSDFWLTNYKGKEMHFLVGYFDEKYISKNFVAVVNSQKGENAAFVNFFEYGDKELTIDLTRYREVPPDTMLYLFTKLIIWAKSEGYKKINLGTAVLYNVEKEGSKTEEKALSLIFEKFNRLYNFKGLYIFKSKFQPDWKPTYFVYPSRLDLTGALIALIRAD